MIRMVAVRMIVVYVHVKMLLVVVYHVIEMMILWRTVTLSMSTHSVIHATVHVHTSTRVQ